MRKLQKFSLIMALALALAALASCGSGAAPAPEGSTGPSASVPVLEKEPPSPSESESPSETQPEAPPASPAVLEPVEYTAEDWAKYLGSYVSLATGERLDLVEAWGEYEMQRPRREDGGRHFDIMRLTPGKDAVYVVSYKEPLIIYVSVSLQDGNLVIESTGEEPEYDTFAGVYAPSAKKDAEDQQDADSPAWREPSSWDEEILANYFGDYVKEDTEIHLQIERCCGTIQISTPQYGYSYSVEVFNPRLVAGTVRDNGDGSLQAGDRNGEMILSLTMENGVLSVENISGMPDYEYLAGVYHLAAAPQSPPDLEQLAGCYKSEQGDTMEIGFFCGKFKLRLSTQSMFRQESFYLEPDGEVFDCFYDEMRASSPPYTLTPQDGGLLLENAIATEEASIFFHRTNQANES